MYLKNLTKFGKSIMFFHTTEESEYAVSLLKSAGIRAASVYGTMNEHARELIYSQFESGEIQVLCNLMLLTEGVDFPDLNTVFVKPSIKGLTIQMGGRALRLAEGKNIANIVQMSGDGYSFARIAKARDSYVLKDGRWSRTTYSKEFIARLTGETFKYKIALAKDTVAMESLQFIVNDQTQKQLAFLDEHRQAQNKITDLEELAAITEGVE